MNGCVSLKNPGKFREMYLCLGSEDSLLRCLFSPDDL